MLQVQTPYRDNLSPTIVAYGGLIIMLLAVLFVVFFLLFRERQNRMAERQKELEDQLIRAQLEVQERTFAQLSQELHDNVGQLLGTTRMLLGVTARGFDKVPEEFRTAEDTLAKAIQDMRLLTKSLNEEWLHQFNLVENLEQECRRIEAARQVGVQLRSSVRKPALEPRQQVMLFRVVQEALQNGLRHGRPSLITISLDQEDARLSIDVADDGAGFVPDTVAGQGVGILNMKQRVKLLGGTIHWRSAPGAGTKVEISVPV